VQTEILICDNSDNAGSTREVAGHFPALGLARVLFEPKAGKSYSLIRLIGEASGDWMLFLDDDVRPAKDLLIAYVDAMSRYPKATLFGGQILPELEAPPSSSWRYLLRVAPGVCGGVTSRQDTRFSLEGNMTIGGGNLAVRRESLLRPELEQYLRFLAESSACCEDLVIAIDHVGRGGEGWQLLAPRAVHHVPAERSGPRWFCRWWFLRGQTCRKVPGSIPQSISLRRFIVQRRFFRLWNHVTRCEIGPLLLTLVSLGVLGAGFLSVTGGSVSTSDGGIDPVS